MDRFTKAMVGMVVTAIVLSILVLVFAGTYLAITEETQKPYCPQEDSCSVDFHNGEWTVTENAPGTY